MDGVDHERPWRMPAKRGPGLRSRGMPADERQRAVCELIGQARVAIRRAEQHMERSAQRLDRSAVRLLTCAEQIRAMTEAVDGYRPVDDGDPERTAGPAA